MKSKRNLIIFAVFIIYLTACSNNETSYFPLNEGYKWQYDVSLITMDGLSKQKYIFNNLGKRKLDGNEVYLRESLDDSILYYSNTDEGIHYLGKLDSQKIYSEFNPDKRLVIPATLNVGNEWTYKSLTHLLQKTGPPQKTVFRITAEIPLEIKIESLNDSITVPAGRFDNCLKISMGGFEFINAGNYIGLTMVSVEQTNWYAPGIGLVKMERFETTKRKALDKGTLLVELAKFER